jgi:DNA polymerase-3 subunit alpha
MLNNCGMILKLMLGYSFNRSHAVAYSMVSYWTAWLKHYYPTEFVFALLKNEGNKDTRTEYLIEAKRLGN